MCDPPTLAAVSLAVLTVLGSSAPALAAPTDSAANHESYWESPGVECTKVEIEGDLKPFTLPDLPAGLEYTTIVLKAGSGPAANTVVELPVAGVAYDHSTGKDLSHVIFCVGVVDDVIYT